MDSLKNSGITWGLVLSLGLASVALGGQGCSGKGNGSSSNTGGEGGAGGTGGTGGAGGMAGAGGGMAGAGGGNVVCDPGTASALPALKLTEIANNLQRPTLALGAPGDTSRLFVLEKPGRIRIVKDGNLAPEPFIDVSNVVEAGANERGLLGLAFHPKYPQNGRFYVYYTRKGDGAIEIAEYTRGAGTPDKADASTAKVLMTIPHPGQSNHNGGMLAFGPDGFLYLGTGDGGGGGDPYENGQNVNAQLGKVLRIDVDSHPTPPPGNMAGGDPYIWDLGLRNPWRFSFDRCTGDLYIADVGQNVWEEINVEPKGQGSKNYGWNTMEANACFDPSNNCDKTGLTMPVTAYQHTPEPINDCSVTGGYVYRGTKMAGLVGTYLYADYCSRRVYTLAWANGSVIKEGEITADLDSTSLTGGIASFGEDTAGELYIVMDSSQGGPGKVFRIDPE
jgi:glucose/arabinose dehydrogenase